jgi:hypothetical protein
MIFSMKIIKQPININEIWNSKESDFVEMLKIVVDIEKEMVAIDAELHADLEQILIENGSEQKNVWGANIYPLKSKDDFIEYTALINIRPAMGNKSMEVLDKDVRNKMEKIIRTLLIV